MPEDKCPECHMPLEADGMCHNPDCPSCVQGTTICGVRIPTHGWGRAIILAVILALFAALALTLIPYSPRDESDKPGDVNEAGIESKIGDLISPESDSEIILAQGSTEARDIEPAPPEPPGGLSWEELEYPGAERILKYFGRRLSQDERAYISYDPYENIKQFYVNLIEEKFFTTPGMSELTDDERTSLVLKNDTGSLTVWVTKYAWEDKIYILLTKLENVAEGRLKPFGGPAGESETGTGE
jgi:hypothetical protein